MAAMFPVHHMLSNTDLSLPWCEVMSDTMCAGHTYVDRSCLRVGKDAGIYHRLGEETTGWMCQDQYRVFYIGTSPDLVALMADIDALGRLRMVDKSAAWCQI